MKQVGETRSPLLAPPWSSLPFPGFEFDMRTFKSFCAEICVPMPRSHLVRL